MIRCGAGSRSPRGSPASVARFQVCRAGPAGAIAAFLPIADVEGITALDKFARHSGKSATLCSNGARERYVRHSLSHELRHAVRGLGRRQRDGHRMTVSASVTRWGMSCRCGASDQEAVRAKISIPARRVPTVRDCVCGYVRRRPATRASDAVSCVQPTYPPPDGALRAFADRALGRPLVFGGQEEAQRVAVRGAVRPSSAGGCYVVALAAAPIAGRKA
jgi:hypothetical protein